MLEHLTRLAFSEICLLIFYYLPNLLTYTSGYSIVTIALSRFILDLASVGARTSKATLEPQAILTTQWTHANSDVTSLYSLDEEYDGRGFDKEIADGHSAILYEV